MSGELYTKTKGISTRWANAENTLGQKGAGAQALGGRKGKPCLTHFKPGETRILAQAQGAGIIRHIWITTEKRDKPQTLKGYKLECFWDGEERPAVSVPLGDFFCFNSGKLSAMENEYFSNPEGRSFNCYIPMPFKKGMKITITNETANIEEIQFFYQVDYTLGDEVSDALYFHAFYNREEKTVAKRDYTVLPALKGSGRYLGASFGVIANPLMAKSWWGEGEVKCYIDGDNDFPTLAGTGTEDYIGTGWGQGRYAQRYQGCPYADHEGMRFSFYRFHTPDPVYFDEDIRVTIQQIGCTGKEDIARMLDNGLEVYRTDGVKIDYACEGAIFERFDDDWCSVAYFYLDTPSSQLPQIHDAQDRIRGYN
ncbi:MAG: glycoside hydrolase family 172 protein [Eubacteriales bacterium]